jgi:phage anti-repressor protein
MNTNEIIPVEKGKLGLEVNSRALHGKLEVRWGYAHWINEKISRYGFEEGVDFWRDSAKSTGGRKPVDYVITLDMAKELAMTEESSTGRMIRRYFIEIEKRYRDWIGFILPRLEVERDLFDTRTGYNYIKLLLSCECSVLSGSVRRRIRRHPQEFWRNGTGHWFVSEAYGRTIVANAVTRRLNREANMKLGIRSYE